MCQVGFFFEVSQKLGRKKNAGTKRNGTHQHTSRKGRERREIARERERTAMKNAVLFI